MSNEEMKTEKNERRGRKIVAGTLVGLGVLGLGMAAATQLNLGWTGNFQAGTTVVDADCQPSEETIGVSYDDPDFAASATTPWSIANVNFTDINNACVGKTYEVAYKIGEGAEWQKGGTGTVQGDTVTDELSGIDDIQKVTEFALTIYSE